MPASERLAGMYTAVLSAGRSTLQSRSQREPKAKLNDYTLPAFLCFFQKYDINRYVISSAALLPGMNHQWIFG